MLAAPGRHYQGVQLGHLGRARRRRSERRL